MTTSPAGDPNPSLLKLDVSDVSTRAPDRSNAIYAHLSNHAQKFRAGEQLTFEGDEKSAVIFVLSGWIVLSKSLPDGQTQIIDFVLPGDYASPTSADGRSSALQVEALTDVSVVMLSNADWAATLQKWPDLQHRASALSAAARARISERLLRLGRGTAAMRVAYALLELGVRLQTLHGSEELSFHVPLTQQRLGEFVGLTSVHVCRTLRRLDRHGVISTNDHMNIHIRDLGKISELAGVEIEHLRQEIEPAPA